MWWDYGKMTSFAFSWIIYLSCLKEISNSKCLDLQDGERISPFSWAVLEIFSCFFFFLLTSNARETIVLHFLSVQCCVTLDKGCCFTLVNVYTFFYSRLCAPLVEVLPHCARDWLFHIFWSSNAETAEAAQLHTWWALCADIVCCK